MKERDRRMRSYVLQDDRNHPSLGLFLFHFLLMKKKKKEAIGHVHQHFNANTIAFLFHFSFENEIRDVLQNNFFLFLLCVLSGT